MAKAVGGLLGKVSASGIVRDEAVRGYAALSLGRCAVTAPVDVRAKATAALMTALDDDHYAVRGFAALGLGFTRDPAGRDALRNLLRAPDPAVRSAGAIALGLLGDAGAAPALVRLASDGPPEQRWGALWGLGLAGSDALVRPAGRLLERRSHPGLRATAAEVLLGVRGEGHRPRAGCWRPPLDDRNRTVRRYAARALGLHAGPHALTKMARALQEDATLGGDTRLALIEALGATGPAALPVEAILRGLPAEVAPELAGARSAPSSRATASTPTRPRPLALAGDRRYHPRSPAGVAELVDALDSGSSGHHSHGGSNPFARTNGTPSPPGNPPMAGKQISIIGVPLDLGAGHRGVDMGPSAIRIAGLQARLRKLGHEVVDFGDVACAVPETREPRDPTLRFLREIVESLEALADAVESVVRDGRFPVVLGGDHSIAMGTMAGLARVQPRQGLIYFDAHGDFNTPDTSPSGNIHGMPVSAILGEPLVARSFSLMSSAAPSAGLIFLTTFSNPLSSISIS